MSRSSGPALLRLDATSRRSKSSKCPVPYDARILLQADAPPFRSIGPVIVVAKLASILDRCRKARSRREGQRNSSNRANESEALRGSHLWHVEGEGDMAAVESVSLAAHFVCLPQAPWNYQCDAREKNAGNLLILPNVCWRPQQHPVYHCGRLRALRTVIVTVRRIHWKRSEAATSLAKMLFHDNSP